MVRSARCRTCRSALRSRSPKGTQGSLRFYPPRRDGGRPPPSTPLRSNRLDQVLVRSARFERATHGSAGRCSIRAELRAQRIPTAGSEPSEFVIGEEPYLGSSPIIPISSKSNWTTCGTPQVSPRFAYKDPLPSKENLFYHVDRIAVDPGPSLAGGLETVNPAALHFKPAVLPLGLGYHLSILQKHHGSGAW